MAQKRKRVAKSKTKSPNEIIAENSGAKLDIGCGQNKQPGFVGMDVTPYPGVDIVHDATMFPWPIPSDTVSLITASHFFEHIPPMGVDPRLQGLIDLLLKKKLISQKEADASFGEYKIFSIFLRLFDEAWRVLKVGGQLAFVVPYWQSIGFAQDPTHIKQICEATVLYLDPEHPSNLWNFYKPKPWRIEMQTFSAGGNLEVVISKRDIAPYEAAIEASRV